MQNNKILITLKSLKNNLTKTEQKIATGILNNPEEIIYLPIKEIAKQMDIGEGSIIRFCKKIGFTGLQQFKLELAKELSVRAINGLKTSTEEEEKIFNLAERCVNSITTSLKETLDLNSFMKLKSCVTALKKARKIMIIGVGTSGIIARDAEDKFLRLGLETTAVDNEGLMLLKARYLTEEDIVLAISNSGNTEIILETLKIAKETGAKVISMTNSLNSKIIPLSDFYLITAKENSQNILKNHSIESKASQLLIIDIIANVLVEE
ncbi:MAG: MurR/RpiR family transcriptional regulator [Cetobacterium sp.]